MSFTDHLAYALLWLGFGAGHSFLAGATAHRGIGRLVGRWHRIAYNSFAFVHIIAIYLIGRFVLAKGSHVWPLPTAVDLALDAVVIAGVIIVFAATGGYRLASFAGWAQLSSEEEDDDRRLQVAGLNRFVRHPLYTGVLMILWAAARSEFGLASAIWGTVYIIVGSRLEERRLLNRFGTAYAVYRDRVPALIPWRWPGAKANRQHR